MVIQSVKEIIENSYAKDITDEFIEPANIVVDNKPIGLVEEEDALIFFNFRSDRAREINNSFQ